MRVNNLFWCVWFAILDLARQRQIPSQRKVVTSYFRIPPLEFAAELQNQVCSGFAPIHKVPGENVLAGLYLPWSVLCSFPVGSTVTWYHLQNMSGDGSHTKSAKGESCSWPRISKGTLQICTTNTGAGCFPSQGEVMESSLMSKPLKFGYHPQNWIALRIAPTDTMPREKDVVGLNLSWATNHLHTNTVARCFLPQKRHHNPLSRAHHPSQYILPHLQWQHAQESSMQEINLPSTNLEKSCIVLHVNTWRVHKGSHTQNLAFWGQHRCSAF